MLRLKERFRRIWADDSPSSMSAAAGSGVMAMLAFHELGSSIYTGMGWMIDNLLTSLVMAAGIAALLLLAYIPAYLLTFIPLRLPRLWLGILIVMMAGLPYLFTFANMKWLWGGMILAALLAIAGSSAGFFLYWLLHRPRSVYSRSMLAVNGLILVVLLYLGVMASGLQTSWPRGTLERIADSPLAELPSPAERGDYDVTELTYGSGDDRFRKEFGKDVDLVTQSVDASEFITRWKGLRTWYWGFDQHALPINGRVWLPEGEGPFPVVLMVHGNHTMEDFSDGGYGYLGELLASRGFLAVSVDQNFVNYSVLSGLPNDDYILRAWLLLHHLRTVDELSHTEGNALSGKADMDTIALIGHSRGGQAAALAAGYETYFTVADKEQYLTGLEYDITAVVAIAPTDKKLEERNLRFNDLNYLTIHGANDSDVTSFDGERQYSRIVYPTGSSAFALKSALYIDDANHGQFNTDWGRVDIKLPLRWLMNQREIMPGEDQRQIAKTFISAFLETTLHERQEYLPLFQDYRLGGHWLPDTTLVQQYQDTEMINVANYQEDTDETTGSRRGVELHGEDLTRWEEEDLKNRQGGSKHNRVVFLGWGEEEAQYTIRMPRGLVSSLSEHSELVLAVAPTTVEQESLDFSIVLTDSNGARASLPLSSFRQPKQLLHNRFLNGGVLNRWIKNGRLQPSTEIVFQDYRLPLEAFLTQAPTLNAKQIDSIQLVFDRSGSGELVLDNVRWQP
ncbi:chlorophyllase/cutinase-like alpha/beta fold protein [Paenibacillus daejeonensis]|uniref:poly(ethylene terephthalate) hydrolase family protein n=1 Tax=Paenibacillus daejeonensis TaxID=135193 RepID=UPI0003779AEC|nr:alpha/beta hydrolase [Paenibacillus daejeonensis]